LAIPRARALAAPHRFTLPHGAQELAVLIAGSALFGVRASNALDIAIALNAKIAAGVLAVTADGHASPKDLLDAAETALDAPPAPTTETLPIAFIEIADQEANLAGREIQICLHPDGLTSELALPADLPAEIAKAIVAQFQRALALAASRDPTPCGRIRLASADAQSIEDRAATGPRDAIPITPITTDLARQAAATPDRIALIGRTQQWSYQQIWDETDARAAWLRSLGAGPGSRIGVCLARTPHLPISIIAILRTGAAFVPMDASHPTARIAQIAADAEVNFILSDDESLNRHDLSAFKVHSLEHQTAAEPAPPLPQDVDQLAYIIYTSGSTGAPKGVMVAHRSLQAEFVGLDRAQDGPNPTTWFGAAAPTFDPSIADMLWTLSRGHTLCIYEQANAFTANENASAAVQIIAGGARRMLCTPSFAALLLADPTGRRALSQLEVMQVGGEPISQGLASDVLSHMAPGARLLNFYGPTECTIWSTSGAIDPNDSVIDLGEPFSNVRLHVLAPDGAEQAAPLQGELCISGPHLSLGYWRRPEQTAAQFPNDPFGRGRIYRTGDIVRRLSDGRIVYVGRRDFQAKVRGHRVELAEIERALLQAGPIEQAIALIRSSDSGDVVDNQLDAFFTLRQGERANTESLRAAMQTLLPAAIIPDRLIAVDAFPLTPNGKIDRRALTKDHAPRAHDATPKDQDPNQMLSIWRACLARPDHTGSDDFFANGGHSLIGARILAAAADRFGVQLPLSAFLHVRTADAMFALIQSNFPQSTSGPLVVMTPGRANTTPLVCVHGAGGNVMLFQSLADRMGKDQPFWGLQAPGVDGASAPLTSIADMAESYIDALIKANPRGPYCLAGFSGGGVVAVEMAHRLVLQGRNAPLVILFDTLAPWFATDHISLADKIRLAPRTSPITIARWFKAALFDRRQDGAPQTEIERHGAAVIAAMNHALSNWTPPPFRGEVVLFRAQTARLSYVAAGPDLGWQDTFSGPFTSIPVKADHETIFQGESGAIIAETLQTMLTRYSRDDT
jgi:amino acid adenylation domain-containing protein